MHHAFIDKVWREWQQGSGETPGRGNNFGGRQPYDEREHGYHVDLNTRIQPWNISVHDALERISGCVQYSNVHGSVVSRDIILAPTDVHQVGNGGEEASVTRRSNSKGTRQIDSDVIPVITEKKKDEYQLVVAKEKIENPKKYEEKVLKAERVRESCVESLKKLNCPTSFIETFQRLEAYGLLVAESVDFADVEVCKEAAATGSTEKIVAEGEAEKVAIEEGKDLGEVNIEKTDETKPTSVATY